MTIADTLLQSARELAQSTEKLSFASPVAYVYNPLLYAWRPHAKYLQQYGSSRKRVVFLGMNPGPWGMAQTGVPFGEIDAVKGWMQIEEPVDSPSAQHPKRPIEGFACQKSEVSGRRLWGLFAERFGTADAFFQDHLVINYCPLVFMEESSRNRTPDKLPASERETLFALCDQHLRNGAEALKPTWIVGVGGFAQQRAASALEGLPIQFARVLHPSPASPAANRGWAEAATKQLVEQGVWT